MVIVLASRSIAFHINPKTSPYIIIRTNPKFPVTTGLCGFEGIFFQTDTDYYMGQFFILKKLNV